MSIATVIPPQPGEVNAEFARWIRRSKYAASSQKVYLAKVGAFLAWIAEQGSDYADALVDEQVRDWAVRDYRRHLIRDRRQAVATVELTMAAVGVLYTHLGMARPDVVRQQPDEGDPRALEDDDLRRFMRAAERRGDRDYAIVHTLFRGTCRVGEAEHLDVDDVYIGERTDSQLHIRYGKGDKQRRVPLDGRTEEVLAGWLQHRYAQTRGQQRVGLPLFTSRQADRLSKRRMQSLVADIGAEVGLEVSPHDLRHTFGFLYLRENPGDLVGLREVLGHKSIKTTAGYARPTASAKRAAMGRATIDL